MERSRGAGTAAQTVPWRCHCLAAGPTLPAPVYCVKGWVKELQASVLGFLICGNRKGAEGRGWHAYTGMGSHAVSRVVGRVQTDPDSIGGYL